MNIYLIKDKGQDLRNRIEMTGADSYCIDILKDKTKLPVFLLKDISIEQANILKQTALSVGCDMAVHRDVLTGNKKVSDGVLMCTLSQLKKMQAKLQKQPFKLPFIMNEIVNSAIYIPSWEVRGKDVLASKKFLIMGILNVTPDSFYDGGRYNSVSEAVDYALNMIEEGADIIDIGGESTRPYSDPVNEEEEKKRVLPVIEGIRRKNKDILISIDTYKSSTAEAALNAGADIVNDISGFNFDTRMTEVIKKHNAGSVIMHIKGTPRNMQENTDYEDLMCDISDYLSESLKSAADAGIPMNTIAVDPGIGFGKSPEQNLEIIRSICTLSSLRHPVLIGASNKSFIGKTLDVSIDERLSGTIAANSAAFENGAVVFRVHNVKENVRALGLLSKMADV